MKKFLKNIILFFILAIAVGELAVILTHSSSDIPQRTIDQYGIQKYLPNQEGYWQGGEHKWVINKLGWPGVLPKNYDNLIIIIGDSFIENFMNPNECHQSVLLKENMADYNFLEAARSGVSFIEAMEISKQMDSLNPKKVLIYVDDEDFYESIYEVKPMGDITQLNLKTNSIKYGEMKTTEFKKVLSSWKLLNYLYNRFPLNSSENSEEPIKHDSINQNDFKDDIEIYKLIDYISENYSIENKTLVFHPNSNKVLIDICKSIGFNVIFLDSSNDDTWTFDYHSHWTCYGHKKAAQQISKALLNITTQDTIK